MSTLELRTPTRDTTELPQATAVEIYKGAKDLGNAVFVACNRPFEGKNPLSKLSPKQYEVLLKLAEGQEYEEIAASTEGPSGRSLKHSTIRTHVHKIYARLGVENKLDAVTFVPIDERRLRTYSLTELQEDPNNEGSMVVVEKLSKQEKKVYKALLDGANAKQIAWEMKPKRLSDSAVRTHLNNIRRKLGVKTTAELMRLGLGMQNLEMYAEELQEITEAVADVLRPSITRYLTLIAADPSFHPLERQAVLRINKNSSAAKSLKELGYTGNPTGRFNNIELDLSALLAYIFLDHEFTQQVILNPQTSMIAREVIRGEVAAFLHERKAETHKNEQSPAHPLDQALGSETSGS